MIKGIKPPISSYSSSFENSKFAVTWNIFVFLVFVFLGLSAFHFFSNDPNITTSLLALFFSIGSLVYLQKTKKYRISSILTTIAGTIISQYAIFIIDDSERITDLMWIMLVSFYAFYTLGSKWGGILLIINISGILIKVTVYTESIQKLDSGHHFNTIFNILIASVVMSFIIHKLIKSSEVSNTELKLLNDQLADQNKEKTILLKEIHHRVKNNLQVVSSLLRLQASEINDVQTKSQFQEAITRISSMALIHEKIYQKEDLANLDLKSYLDSLIEDLVRSYSNEVAVTTKVHSELFQIEIKNVVPIALIFNELITNSLKHAFKNTSEGEINISITTKNKDVYISYKDNGEWIQSEKELSFGMILIDSFTEQLDGKYELKTKNGTEYSFCFETPRSAIS